MKLSPAVLLETLPDEAVEALSTVIHRVRQAEAGSSLQGGQYRVVVLVLEKLAERLDYQLPASAGGTWENRFEQYAQHVDKEIKRRDAARLEEEVAVEIDRAFATKTGEPGYAFLTPDEKSAILQRIETVRDLIERSAITDKKKRALFSRLSAFADEVAKNGTRTDAFFTFLGELAFNTGLMAKNAKPAIDEAKEIMKIVVDSRAKREGISLEKPEDLLQLPFLKKD